MKERNVNYIKSIPTAKKSRILVLAEMFSIYTDEEHQMTVLDIIDYLQNQGIHTSEKTLREDIELLNCQGMDIVRVPSRPIRYFMGNRLFELPELKLLIDAVSASRFITQKKSRELARKLEREASEYQRKGLHRNIYATHRVKTSNELIYYTVDVVNEAINREKQIAFKYLEYGPDLKKIFRNDGEVYKLSPYALFWNEDFYYVVGYSEKHGDISAFRADRLYKPELLDEKSVKRSESFNLEAYSKQIFEMYDGEPVRVRLGCRNDLAKYVVDRFGDKLETKPLSSESFEVTVEVALSPTFYGWLFGFAGGIRILGPSEVITKYNEMLNSAMTAQSL